MYEFLYVVVPFVLTLGYWVFVAPLPEARPEQDEAKPSADSGKASKLKAEQAAAKKAEQAAAKKAAAQKAAAEEEKKEKAAAAKAAAAEKAAAEANAAADKAAAEKAAADKAAAEKAQAEKAAADKAAAEKAQAEKAAAEKAAAAKAAAEAKAAADKAAAEKAAADKAAAKKAEADKAAAEKAAAEKAAAEKAAAEKAAAEAKAEAAEKAAAEAKAEAEAAAAAAEAAAEQAAADKAAAAEKAAAEQAAAAARLSAAAKPATGFDADTLAKCVFALKSRVAATVKAHGVPPADKLAGFTENWILPGLQSTSAGGPSDVVDFVREQTASFGFDLGSGKVSNASDVTLPNLNAALDALCARFPRPHKTWGAAVGLVPTEVAAGSGSHVAGADVAEEELENIQPSTDPTRAELADVKLACSRLWNLDIGRLVQGDDYVLNLQRGKKPYHEGDRAGDPLFSYVDSSVFQRPTFGAFRKLMDNYTFETGKAEVVTHTEKAENEDFLNAIINTPVMIYLYKYLKAKNIIRDHADLKERLWTLWFKLYRRETRNDTCGFEHVFVGEEDDGKVKGMHNWLQLYLEEEAGRLDYRGYIFPRGRKFSYDDPFENDNLITLQFAWCDELKPVSTSFVGVTPEFEVALYTLVFLCGRDQNYVQFGEHTVNVRCYKIGRGDGAMIGTAFPEDPED